MAITKLVADSITSGAIANTPAFRAYMSSNQSITSATTTKVNLDSVTFDTNSAFDTSNYKFVVPSGQAGKYFFYSQMRKGVSASSLTLIYFYVNGSAKGYVRLTSSNQESNQISGTFDLSVGDYVEVYFYDNGTSPSILSNADQYSYFTGYKLIGV